MEDRVLLSVTPSGVSHNSEPAEIAYRLKIHSTSGSLVMSLNSFDLSVPGSDRISANLQFTTRQSAASSKLANAVIADTKFDTAVLEATSAPNQHVFATWTLSNISVESYTDRTGVDTILLRCTRLAESTSITTADFDLAAHRAFAVPRPGVHFSGSRMPETTMTLSTATNSFLFNAGVSDYTFSGKFPGGAVDTTLNFDSGSPNLLYAVANPPPAGYMVALEDRNPNKELATLSWTLKVVGSALEIEASAGKLPTEHFSFAYSGKITQTVRAHDLKNYATMTGSYIGEKPHFTTVPETPAVTASDTYHYTLTVPGVSGHIPVTSFSWSVSKPSTAHGLVSLSAPSTLATPTLLHAALTRRELKTAVVTYRDSVTKSTTSWTMTGVFVSYSNRNGEDFVDLRYASIKRGTH